MFLYFWGLLYRFPIFLLACISGLNKKRPTRRGDKPTKKVLKNPAEGSTGKINGVVSTCGYPVAIASPPKR